MCKNLIFIYLLLFTCSFLGQTKISGFVIGNKEPIERVTIVIRELKSNKILGYGISDSKGFFKINIFSTKKTVKIIVRVLGYKKIEKEIANITQKNNFLLVPEITKLKEVIVKLPSIKKRGDTISYNVSSFSSEKDRTIADVISKMPGIEVLSNGQILYQGKPINKYYIEGLDLLEGKYDLANKNLPFNQVSKVQILENHQPIKVLDSLVFSDKAAMNIKLKKNVSLTGQAKIGLGISPLLWLGNITPMLLGKKKQVIVSYQTNNIGKNVSNQLKNLTIEDLVDNFENNNQKRDWLSTQQIIPPNFNEKRWLRNKVHLVSVNYLQKLKKDIDVRLNVSYLNDSQERIGLTNTLFFLENDTVKISEDIQNKLLDNSIHTNLSVEKNTKKNYLKNSLKYKGYWNKENGKILVNNAFVKQQLSNQYFTFSNEFKNIFSFGKQLLTLKSSIAFNRTPQMLTINPGRFERLLNNSNNYNALNQRINLKNFSTNNSISFTKQFNLFTVESKFGFELQKQKLQTEIEIDKVKLSKDEFYNQLNWFKNRAYVEFQTQFKKNNWRFQLSTPINLYYFSIEDKHLKKEQAFNKFVFEPSLFVSNEINSFWKLNSTISVKNRFGSINNLHYAYILKSYRNLQRVNSILPQLVSQNYDIGLSYRNPIKSLFANIYYTYNHSKENLIISSKILSNGSLELESEEKNNYKSMHSIFGKISKYISQIKTSFTLNTSYSSNKYNQILNDKLVEINIQNKSLGINSNTDITSWFDVQYKTKIDVSKNTIQNKSNNLITSYKHLINLNFYPKNRQYIGLRIEAYRNDLLSTKNNYYFSDLNYRFTQKKIDFEIEINNLFNTKNYQTILVDDFTYINSNFTLRPRQLLVKMRFSF